LSLRFVKQYVVAVVAVAFLVLVVAIGAGLGYLGRHTLKEQQILETNGPQETYAKVLESGVKGRTLVVFDKHAGISERDYRSRGLGVVTSAGTTAPIDAANVVSQLAYAKTVRNVLVVLPEPVWTKLNKDWGTHWDSFPSAAGFMRRNGGVPITFTSADGLELPRGEKVVVLIADEERGSYPAATLEQWTDPSVADLVIVDKRQTR
jgi:hypothetical protein